MTDIPSAPLSCCSTDSDMGPMEEWNRDALVALQGELKINVIMNTGLMDKLQRAAGGFLSRAEAQAVESKPSNAEQMGELIRILLGKGNADFRIFCRMLHQSNNGLWADQLEMRAREFKGEPGAHVLGYRGGLRVWKDAQPTFACISRCSYSPAVNIHICNTWTCKNVCVVVCRCTWVPR